MKFLRENIVNSQLSVQSRRINENQQVFCDTWPLPSTSENIGPLLLTNPCNFDSTSVFLTTLDLSQIEINLKSVLESLQWLKNIVQRQQCNTEKWVYYRCVMVSSVDWYLRHFYFAA